MPKVDLIDTNTARSLGQAELSRVPVTGEMIAVNPDMAKGRRSYTVTAVRHFTANRRGIDAECQVDEVK